MYGAAKKKSYETVSCAHGAKVGKVLLAHINSSFGICEDHHSTALLQILQQLPEFVILHIILRRSHITNRQSSQYTLERIEGQRLGAALTLA